MDPTTHTLLSPSRLRRLVTSAAVAILVATGLVVAVQPAIAAVAPRISVGADVVGGEADGHVDIPFTLSAPAATAVSVVYSFANITAVANVDYTCTTPSCFGTVTFTPGQTTQTVRVGILNDAIAEPLKSFTLNLSAPAGGTIARAFDQVFIVDNDTP